MVFWWLASAWAAEGGFSLVREADGCAISMRPESDPAGAAMRAECAWPEIDPEALSGLLVRYDRYPEFVFPIDAARVVREEGDRALVYQRQEMIGLAAREVLLWIRSERLPEGGLRVSWTTASEEPLSLRPGAVRTPRNVGFWQVRPEPGGGAHVVHEIALDPGGYVPRWLVNLVRTRAFAQILGDVRSVVGEGR